MHTPYSLAKFDNYTDCMEILARAKADIRPPKEIEYECYQRPLSSSEENNPLNSPKKRRKADNTDK